MEFHIIYFEELLSTNLYARELLDRNEARHGSVITTAYQNSGMGQGGSSWTSMRGQNLLMTIIVFPHFLKVEDVFCLSQAAAIAVNEFVIKVTKREDICIKWPNDIYIGDDKVAGILISNDLEHKKIRASIIGIGLNVNQRSFPDELPNPVSLSRVTGISFDLSLCLQGILEEFSLWYEYLERGKTNLVKNHYRSKLYKLGKELYFSKSDGSILKGHISGVDPYGMLMVEANGKTLTFDIKEISYPVQKPVNY